MLICIHVWQYQNIAPRYTTDVIWAQWTEDDSYDWEAEIVSGDDEWVKFNKESQAEFIEDLWLDGELHDDTGSIISTDDSAFFEATPPKTNGYFEHSGVDRTTMANEAVEVIQGAKAIRISAFWS